MVFIIAVIISVILFAMGMLFTSAPGFVGLVQILWCAWTLTLTAVFFLWNRHLKKLVLSEGTSKPFFINNYEFTDLQEKIVNVFERLRYTELEKWDQAAKQAGDSLVLMFSSTTDALTGVANRRRLEAYMSERAGKAEPLSLIMLDIDHFKQVNDKYGHAVGDEVLKHFTKTVQKAIRPEDFLARYGGEEFTVICSADLDQAARIAERVRKAVQNTPAKTAAGEIRVTASLGVARLIDGESPEQCRERADKELYRAKQNGRNRVEIS